MINKDYILRMAEKFGRALAIILQLRTTNRQEEALIYIDDLFLGTTGLTSSLINSVPEDILVGMLSPLGALSIEKCLWVASLLKEEGNIYEDMGNMDESYYRYLKSLYLFLEIPPEENNVRELNIAELIDELLLKLEAYELPLKTQNKLFNYFEKCGQFGKAEDILFEMLAGDQPDKEIVAQGIAFYTRLQGKSQHELLAGNLSKDEIAEGLAHMQQLEID